MMKWSPPLLQALYLLQQKGVGRLSLPQPSWITHVSLIPLPLPGLSVKPTRTGPTCTQRHTHTQAQVPTLDKVEVLASSDQVAHIRGNPISLHQLQFALITTARPKALNPRVATRPPNRFVSGIIA